MPDIGRYIRTLKYLRASQLRGQLMTRLRKFWRDPAKILAGEPAKWALAKKDGSFNLGDPSVSQNPEDLAVGRFCFINQAANLGSPVAWQAEGLPRLWSYNLHYFDWLWSLLPEDTEHWSSAKQLTLDWIENHQPSTTAGGWEPYPVSLRLMNWSLLYGVRHRARFDGDGCFEAMLLQSISRQVQWLELNLETHIQANHLLENLAALVCAGSVFDGDEAKRVLARYLPKLKTELEEQILADGMHYERSPMYHLRILWLVEMLDAVGVEGIELSGLAKKMSEALAKLRHPDNQIALLNDAVQGIYNDVWLGAAQKNGAWSLPDAGYYGFRSEIGHYLIVDAGDVGPNYQPGHAHADYLSFELSMHGRRLITDTGIGTYDTGERRSYDRSTAAHSTVQIAGEDSAEVWGGFRVGRRVSPKMNTWLPEDRMKLEAQHDGYAWLPGEPIHKRSFEWLGESLTIEDTITTKCGTVAISRMHFAPDCELTLKESGALIKNGDNLYECQISGECVVSVESRPSCLEFGMSKERSVLVMRHNVGIGETTWSVRIRPVITQRN